MDNITLEQYKELRRQGLDKAQIQDLQKRGKVAETLNPQSFKQKGLIKSVGSFLGMEEFGKGIAATLNKSSLQKLQSESMAQTSSIQDELISAIKSNREKGLDTTRLEAALGESVKSSQETAQKFGELEDLGVSNREVAGSAIQTGLAFGSLLGVGPTATGVGKLTGITKATVPSAIARGAIAGSLGGAAFGGAEAITEGQAVAPGIAKGAAMGAVTGGVLSGVGQYIKNLSSTKTEDVLFKQVEESGAAKTLKKKFNENTVYKTIDGKKVVISDPISTIVQAKATPRVVKGKIDAVPARETLRSLINEQDDKVAQKIAESVNEDVTTSLIAMKQSAIEKIRGDEALKARGVVKKTEQEASKIFNDYIESYGDRLNTEQINSIRQAMNKVFNADTVDAERVIGDVARKYVYQNAPGTRELLVREGQLIAADKFLDALDGRPVKGGSMGKYFNNLIGAIAGGTTEIPVAGPVLGAAGMNKVTELIQKQALDPIMPKAARGMMSIFEALPTDAAGNISKTTLLSVIGQLSNQTPQQ